MLLAEPWQILSMIFLAIFMVFYMLGGHLDKIWLLWWRPGHNPDIWQVTSRQKQSIEWCIECQVPMGAALFKMEFVMICPNKNMKSKLPHTTHYIVPSYQISSFESWLFKFPNNQINSSEIWIMKKNAHAPHLKAWPGHYLSSQQSHLTVTVT